MEKKESMEPYGEVSYTDRKGNTKTLSVINLIQAEFKDNDLVSIGETDEGNYFLSVDTPEMNKQVCIHLTEGGMIGLLATIHLFIKETSFPLGERLKDVLKDRQMEYKSYLGKK